MTQYDLIIIGGGPAGLAAAVAARENHIESILVLERESEPGGILNQCIHNGFGLHTFREELTGPEYAARYLDRIQELHIEYRLNTMVVKIDRDKRVTAINRTEGLLLLQASAIILAMGCRERPRGALQIPGYRPAGIYTAGTAQRLINMEGFLPGRDAVILGSGDIGLIMARRMKLEGADVKAVAELMPVPGGLKRNIVQCLEDYHIPLKLSHTVINIHGKKRLSGVTLAAVGADLRPVPGTEEYIPCDTLLLSVGLLPENELSTMMGVEISEVTSGPVVNECLETNIGGVFACGNVLHVHDLVDHVSEEAAEAGRQAALYLRGGNRGRKEATPAGKAIRQASPDTDTPDKRILTCIRCPLGCSLTVTLDQGRVVKVEGNSCPRGAEYGRSEFENPVRTVTTTLLVNGGQVPLVSVKTACEIPADKIAACIDALRGITVQAPVRIGDIIVKNVAGTGVNMIATRNVS